MPVYFQISCCFTTPTLIISSILLSGVLRSIWGSQLLMLSCKHAVQDPDIAGKNQYITNWLRQGINWTPEVRFHLALSMAQSAESSSTKSSLTSSKAASLKKSVKKTAKAVTRPFKKLKQSLSASSSWRSSRSQSSMDLPLSDNEPGDDKSNSGADDKSEPEVESELTPEKELGM